MNSKLFIAASCLLATSFGAASSASAQAAAPAAPAVAVGPAIPGLCVFSWQNAVGASTVGKYVNTRMQQIVTQVQAELSAEGAPLETERKALEAIAASKTPDQAALETRGNAWNAKRQAFEQKAALREQEVQATQQKAIARVATEMEPLALQAYNAKKCSILIDGQVVRAANPDMDITAQVVTALNAKFTQFQFDRERLDQAAAGGQAAAPRK
jgi:Skp family chaperone for outer membrane proteins